MKVSKVEVSYNDIIDFYKKNIDWKFFDYLKDKCVIFEDANIDHQIQIDIQINYGEEKVFANHDSSKGFGFNSLTIYKDSLKQFINISAIDYNNLHKYSFCIRIIVGNHKLFKEYKERIKNRINILYEEGTVLFVTKK